MRLFAAIPVADPARAALVELLGALRSTALPVRWVREEGLHLTLKFFGSVSADDCSGIEEMLRAACAGTGPMSLETTELGAFPSRSARVVWVGLDTPPALELLQDRIERAAAAIGFPVEGRPFRPHITLGRVRERQRVTIRQFEALGVKVEPMPFFADRVVLYESLLGPGGARYQPRATLSLEP